MRNMTNVFWACRNARAHTTMSNILEDLKTHALQVYVAQRKIHVLKNTSAKYVFAHFCIFIGRETRRIHTSLKVTVACWTRNLCASLRSHITFVHYGNFHSFFRSNKRAYRTNFVGLDTIDGHTMHACIHACIFYVCLMIIIHQLLKIPVFSASF
jgi:hypothetical protein